MSDEIDGRSESGPDGAPPATPADPVPPPPPPDADAAPVVDDVPPPPDAAPVVDDVPPPPDAAPVVDDVPPPPDAAPVVDDVPPIPGTFPTADDGAALPPPVGAGAGSEGRAGGRRWIWPVIAALLAVALVVAVVLYLGARSDNADLEDQLAAVESDLDRTEDELAEATRAAEASAAQAAEIEDELAEAQQTAVANEASLAEAQQEVADLEAELADANTSVGDLESRQEALEAATAEALAIALQDDGTFDDESAACVAGELVAERGVGVLTDLMRVGFSPDASASEIAEFGVSVLAAGEACGVDMSGFGGAMSYGDDPELDALYDACAAGDGAACDELYFASEVGSEYETFALTCGDHFTLEEAPNFCDGNMPP